MSVIDVRLEESAQEIAEKLADADALDVGAEVKLRIAAPRGASKWVAKIFKGDAASTSRAARGSALVARGYTQIKGEIDPAGDDIVSGVASRSA